MMTEQDYIKSLQADAAHLSRSYDLLFETHQREIKRLEIDRTAALAEAEDSARECEKLRSAVLAALDWLARFGEHAPIMFGGEAELHDTLRAALAPEEPQG